MTDSPITLADIAIGAGIASVVFGISIKLIGCIVDYVTAKVGKPSGGACYDQAPQCKFDHEQIRTSLVAQNKAHELQNEHIRNLLVQNGELIKAFTASQHSAELRHQIVISKLENLQSSFSHHHEK